MFAVPEPRQTSQELAKRRSDLLAGRQRVTQVEAAQHWKLAEKPTE
jgi:hypothetical protein